MKVNDRTTQVSFRLPCHLVSRLRSVTAPGDWPPPPSQTEIVIRGIELVLREITDAEERALARKRKRDKVRAEATS